MELSQPDWPDQDWLSFGNAVLNQIWFAPIVIKKLLYMLADQTRGDDNYSTPNWTYQSSQFLYPVPRTVDYFSPLWADSVHWPDAPWVCNITGKSWWILHSWCIENPLWGNSRALHIAISEWNFYLICDCDMNNKIMQSQQTWFFSETICSYART